jgi:hypothetical protein
LARSKLAGVTAAATTAAAAANAALPRLVTPVRGSSSHRSNVSYNTSVKYNNSGGDDDDGFDACVLLPPAVRASYETARSTRVSTVHVFGGGIFALALVWLLFMGRVTQRSAASAPTVTTVTAAALTHGSASRDVGLFREGKYFFLRHGGERAAGAAAERPFRILSGR